MRARNIPAATPQLPFRLAPFIKLAILAFVIWYAASWLMQIPEVRVLKEAFQRGDATDDMARAAGDALLVRLNNALGLLTPSGTPQSTPVQTPRTPPVEPTRNAPALPVDRSGAGPLFAPPESVRLPPGVSRPGDDVTMPRVLRPVKPAYTAEALRAKVQGTVVLQAVVRTHGAASNIEVVRSLDARFGLDEQAVNAVRHWRFVPGERLGQPVPVLVRIEIPFLMK